MFKELFEAKKNEEYIITFSGSIENKKLLKLEKYLESTDYYYEINGDKWGKRSGVYVNLRDTIKEGKKVAKTLSKLGVDFNYEIQDKWTGKSLDFDLEV